MGPHTLALIGLLCMASSARSSDIYKWTDERGQPHYAAQAPTKRPYQVLRPDPQPSDEAQQRAQQRLQHDMQQVQALREARMKAAEQEYKAQLERAEHDAQCEDARLQLRFLQETQALRWVEPDHDGGDLVHWLDDAEKDRVIFDWHRHIQAVCEPSGAPGTTTPVRPSVVAPPPLRKAAPQK